MHPGLEVKGLSECLNIKIWNYLVSNMSFFHPVKVVGRGSETQLQVGDFFKV